MILLLNVAGINSQVKPDTSIRHILIPILAGLGDGIIATALLRRLPELFPDVRITLVTAARTGELLEYQFPEFTFLAAPSTQQLRRLRKTVDLMILPARNMRHYRMAWQSRPGILIGYNYSMQIRHHESHIERSNRILQSLGDKCGSEPRLVLYPKDREEACRFLENTGIDPENPIVCFVNGGRWRSKRYDPNRFRVLAEKIISRWKSTILLIGDDPTSADMIASDLNDVINLAGKTSSLEVMAIIELSDLVIGPDGGLINMAMALGTPVIGLFGPVDPQTIVSSSHIDQMIFQQDCENQPCYNEEHRPVCPDDEPRCMAVDPEVILQKAIPILDGQTSRRKIEVS